MNTPIFDFVTAYCDLRPARFHMPGHKGRGPLGFEGRDLTEIPDADALYEAEGIIAESEANASALFGCPTFYSTEGSSHCIRAMLLLAAQYSQAKDRFRILATRNCHKTFLSAAALLDLALHWLPADRDAYLSASPTPEALDRALAETGAAAVYLTCPDYLGGLPDLRPLAEVCHARGALLLVDNAHGAYLRFLSPSRHPIDCGADLCCDSAHKTLPVLTGGAYLHLAGRLMAENLRHAGRPLLDRRTVKDALALFGSTSPSYLILQSLDLANLDLETLPGRLTGFLPRVQALKQRLTAAGWRFIGDEPMKLTLDLRPRAKFRRAASDQQGGTQAARPLPVPVPSGTALAAALERAGVYCEFFDDDFLVLMLSPENTQEELDRLEAALLDSGAAAADPQTDSRPCAAPEEAVDSAACPELLEAQDPRGLPEAVCSVRAAMLAPAEQVPAAESLSRVLARPGVSCPPAVPILMPGERIDAAAVAAFARYGIETVDVLP